MLTDFSFWFCAQARILFVTRVKLRTTIVLMSTKRIADKEKRKNPLAIDAQKATDDFVLPLAKNLGIIFHLFVRKLG